ncbi:MAG: chemotaxis response regulator protein-glutamate methylesterase [Saccharospirillaceae bacterium]|nr:chemotaxis response regulator protein-glutamate methylesterase [Pseudomonadales bacterium]NRB79094.1 chemotaxis response regulator protein-glutamate methylesterase [Saccharospirillaceae bacterium]
MPIKVLIVDDSAVVRQVMSQILNSSSQIEVYDTAQDPIYAEQKMNKIWPDVIVLDIEMPRMDGITFLRKIMKEHPTPVVICSSLTGKGTELALTAMHAGAIDIVTKPELGVKDFILDYKNKFCEIIISANQAKFNKFKHKNIPKKQLLNLAKKDLTSITNTTDRIIAIGTSTGGTTALESVLLNLNRTVPGIAVVQHMPEKFTAAFAKRLNSICDLNVKEAESGDRLINGTVLIAPGGKHMEVQRSGAQYIVQVFSAPPVNRHCPSVDVLFRSVAKNVKKNALGIIMTGMGDDGARGLLDMKQNGATTIAQDEKSSIVFGMPKIAIEMNAVDHIIGLDDIPNYILNNS